MTQRSFFERYRPHPWHGLPVGPRVPELLHAYIEITPFDPVKYEIDKEIHARKLAQIRQEFNQNYSLENIKNENNRYIEEENKIKAQIEQVQIDTANAKKEIAKKKEIVEKHMDLVKVKSKRNIRLAALAEKLRYEIEKFQKAEDAKNTQLKLPKIGQHKSSTKPEDNEPKGTSQAQNPDKRNSQVAKTSHAKKLPAWKKPSPIHKQIAEQYKKISRVFLKDMDVFNLFRDCLTSYFGYVKKTQQVTQDDGLKGSLLFEIMQKSAKSRIGYPHLVDIGKGGKAHSQLQDRHMISVVYEGLKNDVEARQRAQMERKRRFKITWEEIKAFNPLQVMGLLVMQWDILGDILLEWEGFLNKKSKLMRAKKPKYTV